MAKYQKPPENTSENAGQGYFGHDAEPIGIDDIGWPDANGPCLFDDQCTIADEHTAQDCVSVEMMEAHAEEMAEEDDRRYGKLRPI